MSDFGTIVSPYRVAPSQGSMTDFFNIGQQRENMEAAAQQRALAEATRQYLGQQMGLPGGVDPGAVQTYQGETQRQTLANQQDQRAQAQEGRLAMADQDLYSFARNFTQNLPQQEDPYLNALQAGGESPLAAQALLQALGGNFSRQGESETRTKINEADNVAAQQRLETELRMKAEAAVAEQNRLQGVKTGEEDRTRQAIQKGTSTGDWSDFYAMAPNAMAAPVQLDRESASQENAAQRAEADRKAKVLADNPPPPSPVGSIQNKDLTADQQRQIMQARVERAMGSRTPKDYAQQVAQNSQAWFSSSTPSEDMQALYPEVYKAALQKMLQEKQNKEFNQELEKTQNPLGYFIKKLLSGAGSVKG